MGETSAPEWPKAKMSADEDVGVEARISLPLPASLLTRLFTPSPVDTVRQDRTFSAPQVYLMSLRLDANPPGPRFHCSSAAATGRGTFFPVESPATAGKITQLRHPDTSFPTTHHRTLNANSDRELAWIIEKQPAFASLQSRTHEEIRAYLDLSDGEFNALVALRRFIGSSGSQTPLTAIATYTNLQVATREDHHVSRGSLEQYPRLSGVSTSTSASYTNETASLSSIARSSWSTVDSSPLNRERASRDVSDILPKQQLALPSLRPNAEADHPAGAPKCSYWCTVCEKPRRFKTYGGWMKHEKEAHEKTVYVCMPDGPKVHKEHRSICVLCGDTNPDESHLKEHNVVQCLKKALTARTYNRRYQLEEHLESHGVRKGSTVAEGWRRGCNKQAWACGFCVAYFNKSTKRFHHIATQHYEHGEDLNNWDATKVILGLLQQPKVYEAWEERMKLQFPNRKQELRWEKTPTRSLITMLELGLRNKEDGEALAMAAFIQSDYYQSRFERIPMLPAAPMNPGCGHRGFQPNSGSIQGPDRLGDGPYSNGKPQPLSSTTEDYFMESDWLQSSNGHLVDLAAMEPYLGSEVPLSLPAPSGQITHSLLSPVFANLGAHTTETRSIQQVEQSSWLGSKTAQPNPVALYDVGDSEVSGANIIASVEFNPSDLPEKSHANFNMSNDYTALQEVGVASGYATQIHGSVHDRSLSPMDLDIDIEATTRILLNDINWRAAQT